MFNVVVKLELQSYTSTTYTIRVASYLLSFIHSALNPFVYGLMSSTFRDIIFKSCAGGSRDAAASAGERGGGGESCGGTSGRAIVGAGSSRLASGTWAGDEVLDDDDSRVRSVSVTAGRRRLLPTLRASSPSRQDLRSAGDPRERSSSQATVLTVAT